MNDGHEFRDGFARVEGLIHALEALPDTAAREAARQLTRCLLDFHAAGLRRLLELVGPDEAVRFAEDDVVSGLLLLHGLHPLPLEVRVARALERVRPHLHSLGGDVELIEVSGEVVRVRLRGNPAMGEVLRSLTEEAVIEAAPEAVTLEFDEAWDRTPDGRVPLPTLPAIPKDAR